MTPGFSLEIDPGNVIIVGTGTWSQDIHHAADAPLNDPDIMYALHFYAGTHGNELRDRIDYARERGAALRLGGAHLAGSAA